MSREALALDISRVVSRVVSGETIDTVERGAALAAKYPEVGMSGESISEAIARAAGMVGMIKSAPPPPKMPFVLERKVTATEGVVEKPSIPEIEAIDEVGSSLIEEARPDSAGTVTPPSAHAIDDLLAAAIDAEIGELVSGRSPKNGAGAAAAEGVEAKSEAETAPPSRKGPLSALRRALFKD